MENSVLLKLTHDTLFNIMANQFGLAKGVIEVLCNQTRTSLKLQKQFTQQEKLVSLGLLSTGLAHKLKIHLILF